MPETNLRELSQAILFDTDKLERFKNIVREHKKIIIIGNGVATLLLDTLLKTILSSCISKLLAFLILHD